MKQISDQEILEALYDREKAVLNQLEIIRTGIVAFGGNVTLIDQPIKLNVTYADHPNGVDYGTGWTWKEKCMAIMRRIKTGYVSDMMEVAGKYEPGIDKEALRKRLTQAASVLYREDKLLDAKQDGVKYKYSLRNENKKELSE